MTTSPFAPSALFGSRGGQMRLAGIALGVTAVCALMALTTDRAFVLMVRAGLSEDVRRAFIPVTELGKADFYILGLVLAWAIGRAGFLRAAPLPVARAWASLARASGFIMAALAFSAIPVHILKLTVGRARPKALFSEDFYGAIPFAFDTHLSSFPSGHSQTIWSIMTALMCLYPRAWPVFASFALLVASSRVIVGSHFPSDVLMGSFIAIVCTLYVRYRWFPDAVAPRFKPYLTYGADSK